MATSLPLNEWLIDIRTNLKLGQDEVDRLTKAIGARVSQSYLSQLERGVKSLEDLGGPRMDALRRVYGLTPEEWVEQTGLAIITPATISASPEPRMSPRSAALSAGALYKNIPRQEEPLDDALLEAARLYGHVPEFAELSDPTMQRALQGIDFKARPQTAQEWLAKFMKFKDDLRSGHDA